MSDHKSPSAGRGQPVLWDPQTVEGHPNAAPNARGFDPRFSGEPDPRRGGPQAVPFGTRPGAYPAQIPAHVQHSAQAGGQPVWSASPQSAPHAPQPDAASVEKTPSLMDRFKRRASEDETVPTKGNAKPFLLGVVTGVVATLLVGQIFSASTPSPDYSYAPPPALQSVPENESEADAKSDVAFLDRVEGLD